MEGPGRVQIPLPLEQKDNVKWRGPGRVQILWLTIIGFGRTRHQCLPLLVVRSCPRRAAETGKACRHKCEISTNWIWRHGTSVCICWWSGPALVEQLRQEKHADISVGFRGMGTKGERRQGRGENYISKLPINRPWRPHINHDHNDVVCER